jgi:UDP-2,3-diacylglucosamine hydrolase
LSATKEIPLPPDGKLYFAGDFHFGMPDQARSLEREKKVVDWLEEASKDAAAIFLMGDQFDFWFEHRYTVPAGFVRFMGKIAALTDKGIPVFMFRGNHDMWTSGYWEKELVVEVISYEMEFTCREKRFYLHHGDGLGKGESGYKLLRKVFRAPWSSWLFARLHPNLGFAIANAWSRRSRLAQGDRYGHFLGEEKEWLIGFCKEYLNKKHTDFFVFGHRHLVLDMQVGPNSRYINAGTWFNDTAYAVFDGESMRIERFEKR